MAKKIEYVPFLYREVLPKLHYVLIVEKVEAYASFFERLLGSQTEFQKGLVR